MTACGEATPTGQVVATVNGEEVTVGELRAEAAARNLSSADDPGARSALIRDVVDRKLWVQQARRDKLDQQIEFVLARRRAEEALLADLMIRTLDDSVEPPSSSDIDRSLANDPSAFAIRTVFQVDQVDFRPKGNRSLVERLARARSLDEAEQMLTSSGLLSQRSRTEWNSLFMPTNLTARLRKLPEGKPFIQRNGETVVVGVVTAKTDIPLSYPNRAILARQSLAQRNSNMAIRNRLDELRAAAKIAYQPGFAPVASTQ